MEALKTKYAATKVEDKPLFIAPKSSEEIFSVKSIDETGIYELTEGRWSKLYRLSDINFSGITDREQKQIITNLASVYNAVPCRFQVTVANEYVNEKDFNNKILYCYRDDKYDELRDDYNAVIKEKLTDAKQ